MAEQPRLIKNPLHPAQGRRGLRGTTLLASIEIDAACERVNGRTRCRLLPFTPRAQFEQETDQRRSAPISLPFIPPGEFDLRRSDTPREARTTSPHSLADDLLLRLHAECVRAGLAPAPFCVDPGGFEPPTFSMPLRRAPSCAMGPSGPEGIRTPDLLSAIEARSQLRYRPV